MNELILTLAVTALILCGAYWLRRNREKYPGLYKYQLSIGAFIYVVLAILAWMGRNA